MTDRQPYIDALSRAVPRGQWIACGMDPSRIRSLAIEELCILFPSDGRHPHLTLYRYPYHLSVEPEVLAVEVGRILRGRAERMESEAGLLRMVTA